VNAFCSVYVGRRPLGAWVAFTDFAERLLAWLAPDALSSTARVVAIAATSAAVGGGVAALPASAQHSAAARNAVRTQASGRAARIPPTLSPPVASSFAAASGRRVTARGRSARSHLLAAGHRTTLRG